MTPELWALLGTAAVIGSVHTLLGPDHYLPFIAMAKARNWTLAKTSVITVLCGIGHVGSSVVLGFIGIAVGIAVGGLEWFEGIRGDLAAWLLTAFGFVYLVWGVHRAIRNRPHTHRHLHAEARRDDHEHVHEHSHHDEHAHVHDAPAAAEKVNITPWILFTIFIFGPCEPLIPILMYPAAQHSVWGTAMVAGTFSVITIGTMLAVVLAATAGLAMVRLGKLERYSHALAGGALLACGVAIHLGL